MLSFIKIFIIFLLLEGCREPADLAIAVDSSDSIGPQRYYAILNFVKEIVRGLPVGNNVQLGLLTYADDTTIRFPLNTYSNSLDTTKAISFPFMAGTTRTSEALRQLKNMFSNGRSNVRNVGLVITDGMSVNPQTTWSRAVELHNDDVNMLSVGIRIRNKRGIKELEGIATDPDDKNFIRLPQFNDLYNTSLVDQLVNAVCNSKFFLFIQYQLKSFNLFRTFAKISLIFLR